MIRFEREGEERVAHWIGGESWRSQRSLERLFGEAHSDAHSGTAAEDETGMGEAPPETARLWCNAVKTMGPDELVPTVGPLAVEPPAAKQVVEPAALGPVVVHLHVVAGAGADRQPLALAPPDGHLLTGSTLAVIARPQSHPCGVGA